MILEGRTALVTGAGQGVGRGVALALAAEGAHVAVVGRTLSKCESVAAEIAERGGTASAFECDVSERAQVEACVEAVHGKLGQIAILVNAAQTTVYGSIRRLTEDDLESQWQSGPMGTFRFMQLCFDDLRATKGSVVNFGSGSSLTVAPAMGAYAAAKESIRVLSRAAAVEWGKHGVRVNVILPLANSPGYDSWAGDLPEAGDAMLQRVPLGRIGDCEQDIGRAVVYLVGPDAGYITGTTLVVDGGFDYLR